MEDNVQGCQSRKSASIFKPKFGVMVPDIDFTEYNIQRSEVCVCACVCVYVCIAFAKYPAFHRIGSTIVMN